MIKYGLSNRYKVDPYGTEEILSEASNSVAPKLTIDYGDEVQEAEFTFRPTKGGLDMNISPVAVLNSIKGNTVAWNQLYDSSVPTALANHKYYLRENNSGTVSASVSTTISYTEDSTERNCIDLTLIYGAGNEPTTAEVFEADYYKWFGKQLTYEDYDAGLLRSVKMNALKTTGFNLWDEQWERGYWNVRTGVAVGNEEYMRCKNFIEVFPSTDYCLSVQYAEDGTNAVIFFDEGGNHISYELVNKNASFTTPQNCHKIKFYTHLSYGNTYRNDICINFSHSGTKDGQYEAYKPNYCNIPVTTLKGKLNGEGSSVVVFPDGMKKAGTVYDEIVKENGVTKAIKRIGSVNLGTLAWLGRDGSFMGTDESVRSVNTFAICGRYAQYGEGTSITGIQNADKVIAYNNGTSGYYSRDCIIIKDSDYSDANTFAQTLNGLVAYYVLVTPEEYILDEFNIEKIMLGSTEVTKIYLGNQLIFEESN